MVKDVTYEYIIKHLHVSVAFATINRVQ